jgi:8-oxo-dGTP diphosphatase
VLTVAVAGGPIGQLPDHGSIVGMPLLVVRHADAGRRKGYAGDDRDRPLSPKGRVQAEALVQLLHAYRPTSIVSSPFVRCTETVRPLAEALGLPVETTDQLAEAHGTEALQLMEDRSDQDAVLCTHGDVALALLDALVPKGDPAEHDPPRLQKGEVWVVERRGSALSIVDHLHQPKGRSRARGDREPPVR